MAQIFISFSSLEKSRADAVAFKLRNCGLTSYFLSADPEQGIRAGDEWERRLYSELRSCRIFLPLLSEKWLSSGWCHAELRIARFLGKNIYPVKIENCSTIGIAPELQTVQLSLAIEGDYSRITTELAQMLRRKGAKFRQGLSLFPGLLPYSEAHAPVFFGRDEEIAELEEAVKRAANIPAEKGPRTVVLTGPSGVGKSSLVRAGLLPDLASDPLGSGFLILPPVRAGDETDSGPESFVSALARLFERTSDKSSHSVAVAEARELLAAWPSDTALARRLGDLVAACNRKNLLIFVDDPSNLSDANELTAKLDSLLVAPQIAAVAVFAVRADRASMVQGRYGSSILTLGPMAREKLTEVVRAPLNLVGTSYDDDFVEAIVHDAQAGIDSLPLMAQVLALMEKRGGGFTKAAYAEVGGLAGAIERTAESAFAATVTNPETETHVRRMFVPLLVEPTLTGDVRLGRLPIELAPLEAKPLVDRFVADRLFHYGMDSNGTFYVEAAHEALLRGWSRLSRWIADERENIAVLGQVDRDAADWHAGGRTTDLLLHRGERLTRAKKLRADSFYSKKMQKGALAYLDKCLLLEEEEKHRDELEISLAQAQKMQAVGQLAGGVAHDFNNLLTIIIGNAEFLLMCHRAGDQSFNEINEIHKVALSGATLVGQLLAFSRKKPMQQRVLVVRDVVGELAVMLRRLLREGIELKLENDTELWPTRTDEALLSNSIINLVINARDAMPKGGVVTIRTTNETTTKPMALGTAIIPAGDYVRIEVSDTGIGIPTELLGKIFDPFFTTKPVGQGTGLGLATVHNFIKQTGGFITVESDVGKGTTFRIFLPRFRSDQIALVHVEPKHTPPPVVTGPDTILLVEDEPTVRTFAAAALRMRGYNVIEAAGGEEALQIVRAAEAPIQLLITNVVMPNMDGPTLVQHVKRLRPDLAILFMSGYAEELFRRDVENAKDVHFLQKPFGLKQLAAKVKEVLPGP